MSKSKESTANETATPKEKKYTIHLYVVLANWKEGDKVVMRKKYAMEKAHTAKEWEEIYQAEKKRKITN